MEYNVENIQPRLNRLIKEQKMTTEAVAKLANVNYNTIIKLRSGANKNPTVKTMIGISYALGVSLQSFLEQA